MKTNDIILPVAAFALGVFIAKKNAGAAVGSNKEKEKQIALGTFLLATTRFDDGTMRGGKQKLRRLVGEEIFYESDYKGRWFYNTPYLQTLSVKELNRLTDLINAL
jgi:hypothetical protein